MIAATFFVVVFLVLAIASVIGAILVAVLVHEKRLDGLTGGVLIVVLIIIGALTSGATAALAIPAGWTS